MLVLAMLFVSCNSEVKGTNDNTELVDVKLAIVNTVKAINVDETYTDGMAVASYEYKATCSSTPGAHGTQATWAPLTVTNNSATLEEFSRGTWTIDVRAKNSNNGVFAQGSTGSFNLTPENAGTLTVTLKGNVTAFNAGDSAESVTVSVGVTVPTLANGSISVRYTTLADVGDLTAAGTGGTSISMSDAAGYSTAISGSSITHSTVSAGNTAYYGSVSLQPGLYAMQVLYKDNGTVVSGQTTAFRVVELAPFAINGTLTAGEYIDLELSTITLNDSVISVAWATDIDDVTPGNQSGQPSEDEGIVTAGVTATSEHGSLASCTYSWFINGKPVDNYHEDAEDGLFLSYDSTEEEGVTLNPGVHTVTCVVSGTIDSVASAGIISYDLTV